MDEEKIIDLMPYIQEQIAQEFELFLANSEPKIEGDSK